MAATYSPSLSSEIGFRPSSMRSVFGVTFIWYGAAPLLPPPLPFCRYVDGTVVAGGVVSSSDDDESVVSMVGRLKCSGLEPRLRPTLFVSVVVVVVATAAAATAGGGSTALLRLFDFFVVVWPSAASETACCLRGLPRPFRSWGARDAFEAACCTAGGNGFELEKPSSSLEFAPPDGGKCFRDAD